jgi:8-oxo-dGTP diphosphatase
MTSIFVAAHALIERDGAYLITRRALTNDYMPSLWDLPGGTVETGETAEAGLMRELMEETSLSVRIIRPIFVYTNDGSLPERKVFQVVYECRYVSGEVALDPSEHDQFQWVTKDELKQFDTIAFLKSFLEQPASSHV